MTVFGWSRRFAQYRPVTDVPERVRRTEVWYWCSLAAGTVLMMAGVVLFTRDDRSAMGLFLAMCGVAQIAIVKIWAHIRLATYQIILELQARDRN